MEKDDYGFDYTPPSFGYTPNGYNSSTATRALDNQNLATTSVADSIKSFTQNLMDSLGIANVTTALIDQVTGNDSSKVNPQSTFTTEYAKRQGVAAVQDNTSISDHLDKLFQKTMSYYGNHPEEMVKTVGGGIASMMKDKATREAADALAQSRINEQNNAYGIEQQKNAAYSASISGLRPVSGIINKVLKRTNGTPVFTNGRLA